MHYPESDSMRYRDKENSFFLIHKRKNTRLNIANIKQSKLQKEKEKNGKCKPERKKLLEFACPSIFRRCSSCFLI